MDTLVGYRDSTVVLAGASVHAHSRSGCEEISLKAPLGNVSVLESPHSAAITTHARMTHFVSQPIHRYDTDGIRPSFTGFRLTTGGTDKGDAIYAA